MINKEIKCNECGESIKEDDFYCEKCKTKEIKKMERNKKASNKRQGESTIRKFEAWEKSGYRTY